MWSRATRMLRGWRAAFSLLAISWLFTAPAMAIQCEYALSNDWGSGFTAQWTITNDSSAAITGWQLNWQYADSVALSQAWNAQLTGSNPYQATGVDWNSALAPGQSVSFGMQGSGAGQTVQLDYCGLIGGDEDNGEPDPDPAPTPELPDNEPDPVALTALMGLGWNAGNSLEAIGGETAWGNPPLTRQLFAAVKAAGFDTVRLPVAWSKFTNESEFTIDPAWLARVDEVVHDALDAGLYVIINNHWDGGWMQPTYAQQDYVNTRLAAIWQQVAEHFKEVDHRLLFAGSNEVLVEGDYGTPSAENTTVQNSFNQTFVDTVRATGGQNTDRYLVVQGYNTNIDHTINFAEIPADTVSDRLLMEVHFYDPYNFTLNGDSAITQWGSIATDPAATESWADEAYVDMQFQRMQSHFVAQGIGVVLGEYGAQSRLTIPGHDIYRAYWDHYITQSALAHQLLPVYWDNGNQGDHSMVLFERNSGLILYPDIVDAIISAQP